MAKITRILLYAHFHGKIILPIISNEHKYNIVIYNGDTYKNYTKGLNIPNIDRSSIYLTNK